VRRGHREDEEIEEHVVRYRCDITDKPEAGWKKSGGNQFKIFTKQDSRGKA
jgi:hypothetical protein